MSISRNSSFCPRSSKTLKVTNLTIKIHQWVHLTNVQTVHRSQGEKPDIGVYRQRAKTKAFAKSNTSARQSQIYTEGEPSSPVWIDLTSKGIRGEWKFLSFGIAMAQVDWGASERGCGTRVFHKNCTCKRSRLCNCDCNSHSGLGREPCEISWAGINHLHPQAMNWSFGTKKTLNEESPVKWEGHKSSSSSSLEWNSIPRKL